MRWTSLALAIPTLTACDKILTTGPSGSASPSAAPKPSAADGGVSAASTATAANPATPEIPTAPPTSATASAAPPALANLRGVLTVSQLIAASKTQNDALDGKRIKLRGFYEFGGGSVINPDKSTTYQTVKRRR